MRPKSGKNGMEAARRLLAEEAAAHYVDVDFRVAFWSL
jgi:hypothetical protein